MSKLNTTATAAVELHDMGFKVVALETGQKNPRTKHWGKKQHTREYLADFITPDHNLGVLEGKEADLTEIDCDGSNWDAELAELFDGPVPETFSVNGRRGPKLFFKFDDRFTALPNIIKSGSLEIRLCASGQFQSCVYGNVDYGGDNDVHRDFTLKPVAKLPESVIVKILAMAPARTAEPIAEEYDRPSMLRVFSAVAALKPSRADDYEMWFKIACALKSAGEEYFSLFDSWSRLSANYGKARETWAAVKPGTITIGTLFHFAKQDGWQDAPSDVQASTDDIFTIISSAELATGDYDIKYIIPDVLVEQQPMLIGGASKSLKTTIILDLAASLASRTPFLNRHPVSRACRVLVMSGESGIETLQETALRICWSRGIELFDLDKLKWSEDLPECSDPRSLAKLARTITHCSAEFLVIDPAYLCLGGDDHANVFAQGQLLRSINKTCADVGTTLLLVHHSIKSAAKSGKPLQLEDLAMSGFSEFARQWMLLNRREMFVPGEPHRLWLTLGGSAGHASLSHLDINEGSRQDEGGRVWQVKLTDYATVLVSEASAQDTDALRLVAQLLDLCPDGLTLSAIAEKTKIRRERLKRLLPNDQIAECQVSDRGSKTKTRPGYKLAHPKKEKIVA